jgi:dienelactone hydrolase
MKKYLIILFSTFAMTMNAQTKEIKYKDGEQVLIGQLAVSKKARKDQAAVLILPAWMGISDHTKEVAEKIAQLGYHAFVADIYGAGNNPKNTKEAGEKAGFYKNNIQAYQNRIALGLQELIKQGANPDKIVIICYCFGGTGALEAARAKMKVRGVVSFHGV